MQHFYCSKCGVELTHLRKAVPGKGYIVDLIEPHECEGYAIKEVDEDKPTVLEVIDSLKDLGKLIEKESEGPRPGKASFFPDPGDHRDDKSKITSTAPEGITRMMRDLDPSDSEMDG